MIPAARIPPGSAGGFLNNWKRYEEDGISMIMRGFNPVSFGHPKPEVGQRERDGRNASIIFY